MRELWLSASAYETWLQCPTKWVLDRVWKMPRRPGKSLIFGTVLHAVLARWLKADETGRDAKGNPIDIYPEYWARCEDGEINSVEQQEVKALVDRAIEQGILVRKPGLLVEEQMRRDLIPGVKLIGTVDLMDLMGKEIVDHKTAKNTRYLLTPASLVKNNQMLIYAGELALRFYAQIGTPPDEIYLRHNQFIREGSRVKKTEALVTISEIDEFWCRLEQDAEKMREQYQVARDMSDAKRYDVSAFQCGGPEACNAYGGCPHIGICSGKISLWDKLGGEKVNFLEKLKAKMAEAAPAPEAAPDAPAAPVCSVCNGTRKNKLGTTCYKCGSPNDKPIPAPAPEPAPVVETASAPEPAPVPSRILLTPRPIQAPPAPPADAPEVAPEVPAPAPAEEKPKAKRRGRPKGSKNKPVEEPLKEEPPVMLNEIAKPIQTTPFPPEAYLPPEARIVSAGTFPPIQPEGPTLYIRCMPVGWPVTSVEGLMQRAQEMILADLFKGGDKDPNGFWGLDAFKRRDMLRIAAPLVLKDAGEMAIFVADPTSSQEMKFFVEGLRGAVKNIVEGI